MPRAQLGLGRVRVTLAAAAAALAAGLGAPACYDEPRPDCGFRCGPGGACPEGYTCEPTGGRCRRDGAPAAIVCAPPDAALPPDAARDAALEAPAR
jgi:hypothetical protein